MLALLPVADCVLLKTQFFQHEIREMPQETPPPKITGEELTMARQLVRGMTKPFDPSLYKDEYQEKLRDLIAKKIEGKEIVAEPEPKPGNIISLMDALKQSLARQDEITAPKNPKQDKRHQMG